MIVAAVALMWGLFNFKPPPPEISLSVSGLAVAGAETKTKYFIQPGNVGVARTDLQFREYASELVRGLDTHGYSQADGPEAADIIILMAYAVTGPTPANETRWVSSADGPRSTSGTIGGVPFTATTHARGGLGGMDPTTVTVMHYRRALIVMALDARLAEKNDPAAELWRETVTSDTENDDLRSVMPAMVAAAAPYFAKDTYKTLLVTVPLEGADVKYIQTGIPQTKK